MKITSYDGMLTALTTEVVQPHVGILAKPGMMDAARGMIGPIVAQYHR